MALTCEEFQALRRRADGMTMEDAVNCLSVAEMGAADQHMLDCRKCRNEVIASAVRHRMTLDEAVQLRELEARRLARDLNDPEFTGPLAKLRDTAVVVVLG